MKNDVIKCGSCGIELTEPDDIEEIQCYLCWTSGIFFSDKFNLNNYWYDNEKEKTRNRDTK